MNIDFNKHTDGLVPAIIQDAKTRKVLMLGYMNQEAFDKTVETNKVTFLAVRKGVYGLKVKKVVIFLS